MGQEDKKSKNEIERSRETRDEIKMLSRIIGRKAVFIIEID